MRASVELISGMQISGGLISIGRSFGGQI